MDWLMNRFSTILVGLLLLLLVIMAIIHLVRRRKKTECGSCDGCPHAQECKDYNSKSKK
jgi:hypothetical protein